MEKMQEETNDWRGANILGMVSVRIKWVILPKTNITG